MRARLVMALLVTAMPLAGCGGDGGATAEPTPTPAATAPADPAAASAEVKQNWALFFDGSKPAAQRIPLVEGGASLGQALALGAKDPNSTKITAVATSVTFTSATQAAVVYDLKVAGTPVLPGAQGTAVLDQGTWKVSKQTFCQLIQLGQSGSAVPGCS